MDKSTGRTVGSSGLHRIAWDGPRFEIGYWARTEFAGKGYITEATAALTAFAFERLGARRIEIRCDVDNRRSKAMPERLGFELEATLKGDELKLFSNAPRVTLIYVRFNAEGLPDVNAKWAIN